MPLCFMLLVLYSVALILKFAIVVSGKDKLVTMYGLIISTSLVKLRYTS